jgi:hypothetical protein
LVVAEHEGRVPRQLDRTCWISNSSLSSQYFRLITVTRKWPCLKASIITLFCCNSLSPFLFFPNGALGSCHLITTHISHPGSSHDQATKKRYFKFYFRYYLGTSFKFLRSPTPPTPLLLLLIIIISRGVWREGRCRYLIGNFSV